MFELHLSRLVRALVRRNRSFCFLFALFMLANTHSSILEKSTHATSWQAELQIEQICTEIEPSTEAAAAPTAKLWHKHVVNVGFLDGSKSLKEKVRGYASQWNECGDIDFDFTERKHYDIRVSFVVKTGSSSCIGTDANKISQKQPSMKLALNDDTSEDTVRVIVLHEFGHALGLIHEHQSPASNVIFDEEAVYKFYGGPPFNWPRQETYENVLKKYRGTRTQYSAYDPKSIMHYAIIAEWTVDKVAVPMNTELSSTDKAFIAEKYGHREAAK